MKKLNEETTQLRKLAGLNESSFDKNQVTELIDSAHALIDAVQDINVPQAMTKIDRLETEGRFSDSIRTGKLIECLNYSTGFIKSIKSK